MASKIPPIPETSKQIWSGRNGLVARRIGQPLRHFMELQASGGIVLLIATVVALVWANSPLQDSYSDFWYSHVNISIGSIEIFSHDLVHFVNDALMTLFFFVVGMEIKRELVAGDLKDPKNAALPAMAAVGGMAIPALIYVFFNIGGDGQLSGWGIPMATDIAFALGVVSLLGNRVPRSLKVFLLSVVIADDIGSILVIAIFYTSDLSFEWLLYAIGLLAVVRIMRTVKVWWFPAYLFVGVLVWWAMYKSGVHATIAGVALGLLTPAKPLLSMKEARETARWIENKNKVFVVDLHWANFNIAESVSVAERLEKKLHPFVTFAILPIFALANAGVVLSSDSLSNALTSRVALGITLGLLVGKTVGITMFTWLSVKLKIAKLPNFVTHYQILAVSMLAGIGFTVALFITALAFPEDDGLFASTAVQMASSDAKIGILVASFVAMLGGLALLSKTCPRRDYAISDNTSENNNSENTPEDIAEDNISENTTAETDNSATDNPETAGPEDNITKSAVSPT